VRRHFSREPGEKLLRNLAFRQITTVALMRRHRVVDFFFCLVPLEPQERLRRIFSLARHFVVEIETHPVNPDEYRYLAKGGILKWIADNPIASRCDSLIN
jgi:hypothetical protein